MKHRRTWVSTIALAIGLATLGALAFGANPSHAQSPSFLVIVHPSNGVSSLSRNEVRNMFLRRTRQWPDGTSVEPVDQAASSDVREAFSRAVHGRSATSVASHWRQQVFSGRGVPPPVRNGNSSAAGYVLGHRGGIGYVSAGANVGRARVIRVSGI